MKNVKMISAPNLVVIGVDKVEDNNYTGRYWTKRDEESVAFDTVLELIRKLDHYYDVIGFPQRAEMLRSFVGKPGDGLSRYNVYLEKEQKMTNIEDNKGDKGTFIVQVKYRQNSTWQGQIVWAEENKKAYFRSVLELLNLMDSAMQGKPHGFDISEDAPKAVEAE